MEVKVRKLETNTVAKLDKLAKEKGMSRDEFLRKELEDIAFKNERDAKENEYKELMKTVTDAIVLNTKILGEFIEEYIIDSEDAYNLVINNFYKKTSFEKKILNANKKINNFDDTKDVLIRDLPIYILDRIDEIVKQRSLNSRSEFLIIYLRQLTYSNTLRLVDEKYKYMLEKTLGIWDFNSRIFKLFYDENIIDVSRFISEGEN